MAGEDKDQLAQAMSELVDSVSRLRDLGRRLTAREEKLVLLARQAPKPRPAAAKSAAKAKPQAAADDDRPRGDWTIAAPESLEAVRAEMGDCHRCKLGAGRKNLVFGEGNPHAELMFIGEAPGADEDRLGRPFVGRAGDLLTKMIEAMGKRRDDVYIANILKSRPPENRDPEPDEVAACEPFLLKQIQVIRPKVIVALGRIAVQNLLQTKTPISQLRGQWRLYHDIKVMPTFHPAYLLRNEAGKKPVWDDLQQVMRELGWSLPRKGK